MRVSAEAESITPTRPLISYVIVSKDEPLLDETLRAVEAQGDACELPSEVVVVDASDGRLDQVRRDHPAVRWIDFSSPPGVRISIPHQRNVGVRRARGEIVVFTDSGCLPRPDWSARLLEPVVRGREQVAVGRTIGRGKVDLYDALSGEPPGYVPECPTINIAFTRAAYEAVGGFDESFEYGSDVDFSWRLVDAGFRIRNVPDAVTTADWGSPRRQLRRAWTYGRARARLYRKHRGRLRRGWMRDPVPFAYGLFLVALPLTVRFRRLPLLLIVPALRNRRTGVGLTLADHLLQGAGFLRELMAPRA